MKDETCAYCMTWDDPSLMDAYGIPLAELDNSNLILFKEQSHPGRVRSRQAARGRHLRPL